MVGNCLIHNKFSSKLSTVSNSPGGNKGVFKGKSYFHITLQYPCIIINIHASACQGKLKTHANQSELKI